MSGSSIRFGALLLRYFGVTVAVVMLALGGFSYIGVGWLAVELSDDLGERAAQLVQSRTYQYIDDAGAAVRIIGGFQQSEADLGKNVAEDHQALWRLLWSALRDTRSIETLYVADIQGNYVQVRREPEWATRLIDRREGKDLGREIWVKRDESYRSIGEEQHDGKFDPRMRPWFRDTRVEKSTYWSEVFISTTSKQAVVAVTYPVTDGQGKISRVIGASVPLERLSRFVVQSRPTWSSIVLLVNQRGEVMANAIGGGSRPVMKDDKLATVDDLGVRGLGDALREVQQGKLSPVAVNIAGQAYRAHLKPFSGYDWSVVVLIPDADALDQLRNLLVIALLVIAAVLLAAVIALLRLSETLSRPLARLAKEAEQIRAFELDAFKGVRSRITEVAQLSGALSSAVEALKGFKRYVPADLVRQLLTSPEFARVGGREAELAVMFTDIFGFTAIAEKLSPKELLGQISEYLELMTGVIMKHGGTVDKYIGDAVMAFWGAPQEVADGPRMACQAALECQVRLVELNARWAKEDRPQLITGIGINVARVVVGNFGSSDRLNYSLLGDGVNLAARLEKLNRDYGTRILISDATLEKISDKFDTRLVDSVQIKGRTQTVKVFELLAEKTPG
ncbi:MAG: adenylate/guanylate cyclase domain-containing protein [Burkholderiales bacterium]